MKTGFVRSCIVALLCAGVVMAAVAPVEARLYVCDSGSTDGISIVSDPSKGTNCRVPREANEVADTAECQRLYKVEKYEDAFPFCQWAAKQGHAAEQNLVGVMYDAGLGVAQNKREAVKWYRLAAEQGYARAQTNLGYMYFSGKGVAQDYREAARWFRLAATQEFAEAQTSLGYMYDRGNGVPQVKREAVKWYRLAAEQGYARAQFYLGAMYDDGAGVIADPREAFIWYSIAAANGDEYAPNNMRKIENQLSRGEILSARAEAKKRLVAIEAGTYGKKVAPLSPSLATVPRDENVKPSQTIFDNLWIRLHAWWQGQGSSTPAQAAFENVWRSVVYIQTSDGQGSGVIVRPHVVATNCHVIEDASSINVYKAVDKRADKSTPYAATARRYDFDRDVCLLDVAGLVGVSAQFHNADSLAIGESVYAVGAPDGLVLSISGGIVSQLRRTEGYGAPTVQTDAAISPGSSGGALTDASGRVVAITTSKRVGKNVEGITFAVPIEWVLEMME